MINQRSFLTKREVLFLASLLFIGCAKTFLVSKDCQTYFFGSSDLILYRMLSTSGDHCKGMNIFILPVRTGITTIKKLLSRTHHEEV